MNKLVKNPPLLEKSISNPPQKYKTILIIILVIFLICFPILLIPRAINRTNVFYGVNFPNGELSFADEIVSYQPRIYFNEDGLANVSAPFNNPRTALGVPNSSHPENPFLDLWARNDVSLGFGGSLILAFKDNLLTGSGDEKIDLWIFEAGERTESVLVEISKDGKTWYSVGKTSQEENGIDIDAFGWGEDDFFAYVLLADNPLDGNHDGIWNDGEWIGWGGADIDAVGAVSSVSLVPSSADSSPFSIPVLRWGTRLLIAFVIGLGIIFIVRKITNRL